METYRTRGRNNTPSSLTPPYDVLIIHPHHPLYGVRVKVISYRSGKIAGVTVEHEGRKYNVDPGHTDYWSEAPPAAAGVLGIDVLRELVKLVRHIEGRS